MTKVVVTGMGIITAIGDNVQENRHALISGKSGIGKASFFKSNYTNKLPFAEINHSNEALIDQLRLFETGITRTELLALKAIREAIKDASLTEDILHSSTTALIGASTVGGMCLTDEMYHDANTTEEAGSEYLSSYSNSANTLFLQKHFAIGGIVNTFNTACSSSANAIMFGARLIQQGLADRAIVGGVDSLAKFTVNGFNSLMILSNEPCRPFDADRKGLNLGEGSGFLVLEKETAAKNKNIYAEVKGFGNSNDAHHPSSTSETADGPYLCMQRALQQASLIPNEIQYINAHGTATENNDETESVAMLKLFETVPLYASTKSYTGHTLGAAGVVEAVFSILALYHQEVYPSVNFNTPIPYTNLIPIKEYKKQTLQNVMSNSFGFAGNCTSLIFSKY